MKLSGVIRINISLLLFFFIGSGIAADAGSGRVKINGTIVEVPCAIDVGDQNQTLHMNNIPISQIIREGKGDKKEFDINLIDCVLERIDPNKSNWHTFQVTFDGENDNGYFGVFGEAKGVALAIYDIQGNIITPGDAISSGLLTQGNMRLRYMISLVSNKGVLRAGDYSSTIRFKMDYY